MKENEIEFVEAILKKMDESESDIFSQIARESFRNLLKDISANFSGRLCPDQYVAVKDTKSGIKIKYLNKSNFFKNRVSVFDSQTRAVIEYNIPKNSPIMILILESPHQDEYYKEDVMDENRNIIKHKGDPIGPAMGETGKNIVARLKTIFEDYEEYHLILMNAIPFQCSLGVKPEIFRYEVFNKAWADKNIGKIFFENRLKNLLNKLIKNENVIIVNACTKGHNNTENKKPFLWRLVVNAMKELTLDEEKNIPYFRVNHPSSWWSSRNRKIQKEEKEEKEEKEGILSFKKTKK